MSQGEGSSRNSNNNNNGNNSRGNHSARQASNRSRHQEAHSPEWDGGAKPYGYFQGNSHGRNQYKTNNSGNANVGNNNHNKNFNDSESKELLDKFEALGRERRGDKISSYKVNSAFDDTAEPEWLDPTDAGDELPAFGHSIQEFEEWKAKMKAEDRLRAGIPEEPTESSPAWADENPIESSTSNQNAPNANYKSADRLFGMWDMPQQSDPNSLSHMGRASRFSRFFKGDSAPPTPAGQAPPGLMQQPMTTPDLRSHPSNTINSPALSQATPPGPVSSENEADEKGFMRIMAMLGDEPTDKPSLNASAGSEKQQDAPPPSDDAFFMSLLNKSGNPGTPGPAAQASPAAPNDAPSSAQNSPLVSRGVTPALPTPQASMATPQKEQFQMDPFIQGGPPPEWIQQQIVNGNFPPNGPPPPGFIPPPFMNGMNGMPMPPPGMLPPFQPGQNGMPPLPPHMMPPPPPNSFFEGMPPNFQMQQPHFQQPMNGQFPPAPTGMQPPPFGMPPKSGNRRFEEHKVN